MAAASIHAAANNDDLPKDDTGLQFDASEIAARAVASALTASGNEGNDDPTSDSYDAVARDLLLQIDAIEKERGHIARELETPLVELGKLYASTNQCTNAIPLFKQTILLIRQLDGVMNARQIPVYDHLIGCYISEQQLADLDRALEQVQLIHANALGKDDLRLVPALVHIGECYEQAGLYEKAVETYQQALHIAQRSRGKQDPLLIAPLRALARTYRLSLQFESGPAQSLAQGQRMLEWAARIAREASDIEWQVKASTLIELGDWLQLSGSLRQAPKIYREAWHAAANGGGPESAARLLGQPAPLLYRAAVGVPLRRPPQDTKKMRHYWIDCEFTVTRVGEVQDVLVRESTAPKDIQHRIAENLKHTRFRPALANGEVRDAASVRIRQGVWVQP